MTTIREKIESKQGFLTKGDALKDAKTHYNTNDIEIHILKFKYTKLNSIYDKTISTIEIPTHLYGYEIWKVHTE